MVHGRLETRTFVNANNVEVLSFEIDAVHVGHDLSRGTSAFASISAIRSIPAQR